jgi:hypothetical protein
VHTVEIPRKLLGEAINQLQGTPLADALAEIYFGEEVHL